jgi:uncharacterized membrane protein
MKQVRILAVLQALCLVPLLLRFLLLAPDFSAVGLWLVAIVIAGVSIPYALWQFLRHPERRPWAGLMVVLAVTTIVTPLVMTGFDLPPIPLPIALVIAVVIALLAAWLLARPRWWDADHGWGSGRLNIALLVLLMIWIVLVAALLIAGLVIGFPPPLADHRNGLALDTVLIHAASIGALGLLLGVFALLFSAVGLWRRPKRAFMHWLQLAAALVLIVLVSAEALLISILIVNPG